MSHFPFSRAIWVFQLFNFVEGAPKPVFTIKLSRKAITFVRLSENLYGSSNLFPKAFYFQGKNESFSIFTGYLRASTF